MEERYLIDSNAVIDFCSGKLSSKGRDLLFNINPIISIITNIELFATTKILDSEIKLLKSFVEISIVLSVDNSLLEKTIEIRQKHNIKFPDAIIAATALVNNLILVTRNSKDFENIEGLKSINPHL